VMHSGAVAVVMGSPRVSLGAGKLSTIAAGTEGKH
jgi:hypothetical protein